MEGTDYFPEKNKVWIYPIGFNIFPCSVKCKGY